MARSRKKKINKFRLAFFGILLVCLFAGGFVAANNYLWPLLAGELEVPGMSIIQDIGDKNELAKLDGMSILMMGVDERDEGDVPHTDTMILANINQKENRVALLSIPRDTKVSLPGYGTQKINAVNVLGGPKAAKDIVSDLTGVKVDYYITTNFEGFKGIVDALGGVTLDVEKNMRYIEKTHGGAYNIDLKKGEQKLDGHHALMYVRYRNDALGDISRTQRQLKLLTAIGEKAMQPSSIVRLPSLVNKVYKNVKTDLGLKQLVKVANAAKNLDNLEMVSQTLPGWFLDEKGGSYWYVDPSQAKRVTTALFRDGQVVDVVQGDITEPPSKQQVAMYGEDKKSSESRKNTSAERSKETERKSTVQEKDNSSKSKNNSGDKKEDDVELDEILRPRASDSKQDSVYQGQSSSDGDVDVDNMPPPGYYPRHDGATLAPEQTDHAVQIIVAP